MEKLITAHAELDVLVDGRILHESERDLLCKAMDNGYQLTISLDKETRKGEFPLTVTLKRKGVVKKQAQVKPSGIVDVDGKPMASRKARRAKERKLVPNNGSTPPKD